MTIASQPIPDVSEADVQHILLRDYPADMHDEAMVELTRLGGSSSVHKEPRIYLAVLKLANGSLEQLKLCVDAAVRDYRDVLMEAEYLRVANHAYVMERWSRDEQQVLIDADWEEYKRWLGRADLKAIKRS